MTDRPQCGCVDEASDTGDPETDPDSDWETWSCDSPSTNFLL